MVTYSMILFLEFLFLVPAPILIIRTSLNISSVRRQKVLVIERVSNKLIVIYDCFGRDGTFKRPESKQVNDSYEINAGFW